MSTRKRVNGAPSPKPNTSPTTTATKIATAEPALHTPFLPTPLELLLLALYPLTLLLGSLFATLNPWLYAPTNLSTYSPLHQSYQPPTLAPSYFAQKSNFLNLYFVKIGWFWCSLALLLFTGLAARGRTAIDVGFAAGHPRRQKTLAEKMTRLHDMDATAGRAERDDRLRRVYQVALRYALLTGLWYLLTQSIPLAGPSLIAFLFRRTGGACYVLPASPRTHNKPLDDAVAIPATTLGECRRAGGRFAGGLDISGHVFLLVLGTGMLFFEALPVVVPWVRGLTSSRLVKAGGRTMRVSTKSSGETDGAVVHGYGTRAATRATNTAQSEGAGEKPLTTRLKEYALYVTTAVLLLSWWMLLMTAAFFHSWVEKGGALVVAGVGLWGVYCLPRGVEGVRAWVGVPGV